MASILIVDDRPINRQFLVTLLGYSGHRLLEAADGAEGLKIAHAERPDLIIADVVMPRMDGFEFIACLRRDPVISTTRVIFYTGNYTDLEAEALARQCGVFRILTKPCDPEEILRAVEQALESGRCDEGRPLPEQFDHEHLHLVSEKLSTKICENEKLAELCQTAERFVDDVSHEFRTPLTVIQGYCAALSDGLGGPVNPQQQEFLQIVLDRARDLAQMVDDLLDSSKLRSGSLRVDRREHDIESILAPVRSMLEAKALANKIILREQIEPGLPHIFADAEKAARVIVNLVVNAIKFSPEGAEVTLSVRAREMGDVLIAVSDQGRGIARENLSVIFKRFKQVGDPRHSSIKGFGLGLSIAKELVELNLGSIDVQSEVGKGSTFSFTLPVMDWKSVLSRFIRSTSPESGSESSVALLRVVPKHGVPEDVRSLVVRKSYPRDLVLETAEDGSFLVLGFSRCPAQWVQRLHQPGSYPEQAAMEFDVETIGSWAYPAELETARAAILAHLPEALNV
jgi:signal transduction histidine kinase